MTFHPTWRDRVALLIVLVVALGLVGFTGFMVLKGGSTRIGSWREALIVTSLLLVAALYFNWFAYHRSVQLDDQGIRWKDWTETVSLRWEEIQGMGFKQYPKVVKAGLVLKEGMSLKFLPFYSPELYQALSGRLGRLPAEIEKSLATRR